MPTDNLSDEQITDLRLSSADYIEPYWFDNDQLDRFFVMENCDLDQAAGAGYGVTRRYTSVWAWWRQQSGHHHQRRHDGSRAARRSRPPASVIPEVVMVQKAIFDKQRGLIVGQLNKAGTRTKADST